MLNLQPKSNIINSIGHKFKSMNFRKEKHSKYDEFVQLGEEESQSPLPHIDYGKAEKMDPKTPERSPSPDKNEKKKSKKAVFCSQLAAMIYEALELNGFDKNSSGRFTPVELNASPCFEKEDLYVKFQGKFLVKSDGITLLDLDTKLPLI